MKLFGWLAVFLILLPFGLAQSIDNYSINYDIVGNKAFVTHDISFLYSATTTFEFGLPKDAKDITLEIDNQTIIPIINNYLLDVPINPFTKSLKITYISGDPVSADDEFLIDAGIPYNVKNLEIKVALPEQAILRTPLSEGGSVFPKPANVETDGLQLYVTWKAHDLKQGDNFGAFVLYNSQSGTSPLFYVIIIALIVIVIVLTVIRTKRRIKVIRKQTKHRHEDIASHLKEDEKQIVNVLKQRDGQCEQGTLRVVTGIPKASLSRLLMELEARNVVYKEKRGKKNIIFLKS